MINIFEWRITHSPNQTDAVCTKIINGNTVDEGLRINLSGVYSSDEEAMTEAKPLVKMQCIKDMLKKDWDHLDATLYAIANNKWLDNKLIDAARKRWGAANYLAEQWLLLGVMYLDIDNWQKWIDRLLPHTEDTEVLRVRLTRLKNKETLGNIYNWLLCQTPISEQTLYRLWIHNSWSQIQGSLLHHVQTASFGGLVLLSGDGIWRVLLTGGVDTALSNNHLIETYDIPTIEMIHNVWSQYPTQLAEQLINFD